MRFPAGDEVASDRDAKPPGLRREDGAFAEREGLAMKLPRAGSVAERECQVAQVVLRVGDHLRITPLRIAGQPLLRESERALVITDCECEGGPPTVGLRPDGRRSAGCLEQHLETRRPEHRDEYRMALGRGPMVEFAEGFELGVSADERRVQSG